MYKIGILSWLVFSLMVINALAQSQNGREDIRVEARKLFSEKDYAKALPLYRELLNSFPKEPEYQFSAAVCIINLNGDKEEAIRMLKPMPVSEFSPLASYYLGKALHMSYSFEDAIKAYSRYVLKSKGGEPGTEYVERLIEMARNGIEFTRLGYVVNVQNKETIQIDQLQLATAINGSGKLMRKPIEFCSKTDIRNGYRPWMFLPSYTELNEYVYAAGFEPSKKDNKQIFRIRNINHETWGLPEPLDDVINTRYDEEFPFFDPRTSTLYFSSMGHSSMGGYDIFSSVYNWNTKTWSQPKNLGFPINSPYDDFLYITDGFGSTVSFVSTRSSEPGQAVIYRLKLEKDTAGVKYNTAEEIKEASMLQFVQKQAEPGPPDVITPEAENTDKPAVKPQRTNYNKVLAEALKLQLRADSATRVTRDLRIMAKEMHEDSISKQIIDDILRNDKLAKSLQRQANDKFAEARNLKNVTSQDSTDESVTLAKEVNGIKVYQYRPNTNGNVGSTAENPVILPETSERSTETIKKEPANKSDQFSIQSETAYSDMNPIPQGLSQHTGLIYRIQLGVFSKARPNDAFGGINPVAYEQIKGTAMLKYYAGLFYTLNSVTKALESIRSLGFPDAFIVAFYNGELITTEKAREIEFAGFKL